MKTLIASAFTALLVGSASAYALTNADLYGSRPQEPVSHRRTIPIDNNTKYVNVVRDEVVDLVINGKDYPWEFAGTVNAFPLNAIVPAEALDHTVMVYVDKRHAYKP